MQENRFDPDLLRAIQVAHRLTNWMCARCASPHSCCKTDFCLAALANARRRFAFGSDLSPPETPFILASTKGCLIPAPFRIGCSLHVCKETVQLLGSSEWKEAYFGLSTLVRSMWNNTIVISTMIDSSKLIVNHKRRNPNFPPRYLLKYYLDKGELIAKRYENSEK